MKKISVLNTVAIEIDDNYKWKDTIFIDEHLGSDREKEYNNCSKKIKIKYSKKIDYSKARRIEDNFYACDKYIYDKKMNTKISFEKNECTIETNQEINEWLIIILQLFLVENGYSFIHAAAVSNKNDQAILMPSWGGVGKTATVSKLIKEGYKLLGDDLNILSEDGHIYGFPKKFVLYYYHKNLFPQVFQKNKIICGSALNNIYTKIIPTIKNILRKMPVMLAFARKHNPQSIKVSPFDIFGTKNIAKKAVVSEVFWLEREVNKDYEKNIDIRDVISKSISVTMNEIFNEKMNAILIMCGMGLIEYDSVFEKTKKIYRNAIGKAKAKILCIDTNKKVELVADRVLERKTI